jgi:hypothetical protein
MEQSEVGIVANVYYTEWMFESVQRLNVGRLCESCISEDADHASTAQSLQASSKTPASPRDFVHKLGESKELAIPYRMVALLRPLL